MQCAEETETETDTLQCRRDLLLLIWQQFGPEPSFWLYRVRGRFYKLGHGWESKFYSTLGSVCTDSGILPSDYFDPNQRVPPPRCFTRPFCALSSQDLEKKAKDFGLPENILAMLRERVRPELWGDRVRPKPRPKPTELELPTKRQKI